MGATWSFTTTFTAGDILTASELNILQADVTVNFKPSGMDDQSVDIATMQDTDDPGEVGTESLATDLAGEILRLRNIAKEITGEAQWYVTPSDDLIDLKTDIDALASTVEDLIEGGTVMIFKQASAPTGWSLIETDYRGATIEIINDGTSDVSGSYNSARQGSHSINGGAPNHTHTASHHHNITIFNSGSAIHISSADGTEGSFTTDDKYGLIGADSSVRARLKTSTTNPTTSNPSVNFAPYYNDVIVCSKD